MAYTHRSLERTKNLIYNVKRYSKDISKSIEKEIQSKVINPLAESWYTEEGVVYVKGLKENLESLSCEIAANANDVIKSITSAYDYWLSKAKRSDDEEEAEIASHYWYISFEPNTQVKTTSPISVDKDNRMLQYRYTSGGERREFGYQSSSETKFNLTIDSLASTDRSGDEEMGIKKEKFENVISNIDSLLINIDSTINSYQNALSNTAYSMGYESGMSRAVSNFDTKMKNSSDKIRDYIKTGLYGSKSVPAKVQEVIDRYGETIVREVTEDIDQLISELK